MTIWDGLSDHISINIVINLYNLHLNGRFIDADSFHGDNDDLSSMFTPVQTIRFKNSAINKNFEPYKIFNANNKLFHLVSIEQGSGFFGSGGYTNLKPDQYVEIKLNLIDKPPSLMTTLNLLKWGSLLLQNQNVY